MVEIIPPATMDEHQKHTAPLLQSASAVPDFVTKTKEYVKQHPEVIREVAGDEIAKVEEWLDTFPVIGDIAKAKLNEFLGGAGIQGDSQQGGKDAPGRDFIPSDGQGQGDGQQTEPEDNMTTGDMRDILEFIADLSEQGFSLPEISDAVWRDYRIEYHPLKIKRMLKSYYGRPDTEAEGDENRSGSQNLKIYQKLLEKNADLARKVAELTPKTTQELPKTRKAGLFRRIWRGLFGEGE